MSKSPEQASSLTRVDKRAAQKIATHALRTHEQQKVAPVDVLHPDAHASILQMMDDLKAERTK